MLWVLVDVALALFALSLFGLAGLRLWRAVKGLGRDVSAAGELVGAAGERLAAAQAEGQRRNA